MNITSLSLKALDGTITIASNGTGGVIAQEHLESGVKNDLGFVNLTNNAETNSQNFFDLALLIAGKVYGYTKPAHRPTGPKNPAWTPHPRPGAKPAATNSMVHEIKTLIEMVAG